MKRTESKKLDTLETHFEEFSELFGEWLLLKGDQLLAHSSDQPQIT